MHLSPKDLMELEALAMAAATLAGECIQAKASGDIEVKDKNAGSSVASQLVTNVDLAAQAVILEVLSESMERFHFGLLTEEQADNSSRHQHDHFWCIDPMDGTLAFTKRSPGYSVSIALVNRHGTAVIGVVHDPVTNTTYHAIHGQGARRNHKVWDVRPTDGPLRLMVDHSFIGKASDPAFQKRLTSLALEHDCQGVEVVDHAGAVLNACWVAERAPALYFKVPKPSPRGGSLWDFAATSCLFAELRLPCSDFHGKPLHLNPHGDTFMNHRGVLYASHPTLAAAVEALVTHGH